MEQVKCESKSCDLQVASCFMPSPSSVDFGYLVGFPLLRPEKPQTLETSEEIVRGKEMLHLWRC